jgi:DNA repair protein RecO (recombination protein O)
MLDERTQGIILRTRPLTETSLVVHWLTRDFGRLATVAKGACRPKSPFRGKVDLFFEADLSFVRSRKSDLHLLREVCLQEAHSALRRDLDRLQQAAYAADLVELGTETEAPMPTVFTIVGGFLKRVEKLERTQPMTILALELKILHELGLRPDLKSTTLSPGSRKVAQHLSDVDWPELDPLQLSDSQLRELRQFLHGFLIYHLGRLPKGRATVLCSAT